MIFIFYVIFLLTSFLIYVFIHKSILSLTVSRTLIFYPEFNSKKDINSLYLIASQSVMLSFLFSPALSFIILRTFNLDRKNKPTGKFKLSRSNRIFKEIFFDLFSTFTSYATIYYLLISFNFSITFYTLSIIFIIISIFTRMIINDLDKNLDKNLNLNYLKISNYQRIFSFIIISFSRIFRRIIRDIIIICAIYIVFKSNEFNYTILKSITFQSLIFNSSNYLQILPANLVIPEILCSKLNCILVDYIWLRLGLFLASFINWLNFKYLKKINS